MGKKEKTEVGDEDGRGEGIKKNPEQICPYLFWDSFELLPQLAAHTRTSGRLEMICNTARSSDKQSESVNFRPKQMASTRSTTWDTRTCPGPKDQSIY